MGIGDTKFGVQVGIGTIGRVVTYVIAFFGSIFLARVLGPSEYGTFYLLVAVVAFLDNPVTGWAEACRKRLTEITFPSDEAIGSTIAGIAITTPIVVLLSWLASPYIDRTIGTRGAWWLMSALFIGTVSFFALNELLKGTERFGASSWVMALRDTVRVLAQAGLVLGGMGVAGMVGGMVFANLIVVPVLFYFIGIRPRIPHLATAREIWSYAKFSIPGRVVGTAQLRIDHILLGVLASSTVVGYYEVAIKLTLPAMFVAGIAQDGLMGRISNLKSRGEDFSTDVQRNLAHASIVGIPLFFGALVVGEPVIVTVYSSQYAAAAQLFVGLALFRLIRTQKVILSGTINGLDKPDLNLRVSAAVFVFNVVTGIALFFAIGPIGVVVATIISESLGYVGRAYHVRALVPSVRLFPRLLLDQFLSGAIMAGIVLGLISFLPFSGWQYVLLLVGIGAAAYFVVLWLVSTDFRQTVRALLRDAGGVDSI